MNVAFLWVVKRLTDLLLELEQALAIICYFLIGPIRLLSQGHLSILGHRSNSAFRRFPRPCKLKNRPENLHTHPLPDAFTVRR